MAEITDFPSTEGFNLLEEIFESLDNLTDEGTENGLKLFAAMLETPEEQFSIIAPALLESFEQTFNMPDAQLAFVQMMNMNGIKIEDLQDSMDEIVNAVDEQYKDTLSEQKRDFIKSIFAIFFNSMANSIGAAKRVVQIPIELCREGAKLPTYATIGSAAMDLYSPIEFTVHPGETMVVPLGIKVNIPRGYALLIQPRSGMSIKTKLRIPNTPGLIDSDYHEELALIFENISNHIIGSEITEDGIIQAPLYGSDYTIGKGERCAQMRLVEVPMINWLEVESIGSFEEDHGKGFGSSGSF